MIVLELKDSAYSYSVTGSYVKEAAYNEIRQLKDPTWLMVLELKDFAYNYSVTTERSYAKEAAYNETQQLKCPTWLMVLKLKDTLLPALMSKVCTGMTTPL